MDLKKRSNRIFLLGILFMCVVIILCGCNGRKNKETEMTTDDTQGTEAIENEETEDKTSKEVLVGVKWWDGDQSSRDYVLSGDGYIVFEIYASPNNDKTTNAYCVEAYDNRGHYLTSTSDATAWFAGTAGTVLSVESNGPAVPGETVRVIFTRMGNEYTIEYLDAQTDENIFDKIVATEAGNFETVLKLHVMAEIGTFEVKMVETGTGEYEKQAGDTNSIMMEGMTRLDSADDTHKGDWRSRVSVHDPSIVIGYINELAYTGREKIYAEQNNVQTRTKVYFIFGTCLASAYSSDLENWTSFENNLNRDYEKILKNEKAWAEAGDSDYNLFWSIWAPDVIWNPKYVNDDGTKGAWMMYVSINGAAFNSSIALLTTTDLRGDWVYRGTVIYSGYSEKGTTFDYTKTDYLKYAELDSDGTLPDRYVMPKYLTSVAEEYTTWNKKYGGHAIDPAIFFDEDGIMRLVYGSFAGGIYMLEMDPVTGFRNDRIYALDTYSGDGTASDPYCGIKLAGGNDNSVEGAYIKYFNGRYYLFVSVGGCYTYTGYNMRVFSSEEVEGEYKDFLGNSAFEAGPIGGEAGARLMFNYKWSWKKRAQLAQGHNSVYVDEGGNIYLIYHEKTDNGTNDHTTRVHQMFETSSGALVVAPFEYSHTDETGVVYSEETVVGTYDVILHKTTDYANYKCNKATNISLNKDYTITGDSTGTWRLVKGTANIILTIGDVEFHGRLLKQTMEDTSLETICFTTISQELATDALWGMKLPGDADSVRLAINHLPSVDKVLVDGATLSTEGPCGTVITWYCDTGCVSENGVVMAGKGEESVTIYAIVSKGEYYGVKSYVNRKVIPKK